MQKLPKVFPRGKVAFIPEQPDGSEWYNLVFQAKIDGIPHDYKVYRRWNDDSDRVAVIQLKDDVRRWSRNPTERKQATLESVDRGEPPYANIADFLKGFQPERSAAHSTSQGDYQPEDIPTAKDAAQPKKSVRKTPRRETRVLDETPGDRQRRIQQELRDTQRLFRGGKRDTDDGILQGFGR